MMGTIIVQEVVNTVVPLLITALAAWLGARVKEYLQRASNTTARHEVTQRVVQAVEQMYSNLSGSDKLDKAVEMITAELEARGVSCHPDQMRSLIESAVYSFKKGYTVGDIDNQG
jgi:hypothetical protein